MDEEAFEQINNLWIELGPLNLRKLRTIQKLELAKVAGIPQNLTPRVHNPDGSVAKTEDYHKIV